jgi:uncharacterized protein (DUF2147 family)
MLKKYVFRLLFLVTVIFGAKTLCLAQDQLERNLWYNEEKTAKIQIYKAQNGKFYGKIVWLKEPDRDGKPKLDINNTDKSRRSDPVMGMAILKDFKKDGDKVYEDGTIYDPKNGKTYSCKMTFKGDKLDVRGYVGFSLLGRTTTWTKVE